jgi:hypothetical protein
MERLMVAEINNFTERGLDKQQVSSSITENALLYFQ